MLQGFWNLQPWELWGVPPAGNHSVMQYMRLFLWIPPHCMVWERGMGCQLSCSPTFPSFPPYKLAVPSLLKAWVRGFWPCMLLPLVMPPLLGGLQVGKALLVSFLWDLKDNAAWGWEGETEDGTPDLKELCCWRAVSTIPQGLLSPI